jgi:hypothetical protein
MKRLEILADIALLGLILASACRPTIPTADELADLAAVVDEARELAPVARTTSTPRPRCSPRCC